MNGARNVKKILAPPPGALGRGQKVKYHLISITKSISKIFFQTLCVFSQMKDTKHIRRVFLFCRLGHAWGYLGAKIKFRPAVCPLCYLLLNHLTKLNQIWCVSYSHKWEVQRQICFGPASWGPWEGSKGQISFNFNYKVNFKDFYSKLCLCSHK